MRKFSTVSPSLRIMSPHHERGGTRLLAARRRLFDERVELLPSADAAVGGGESPFNPAFLSSKMMPLATSYAFWALFAEKIGLHDKIAPGGLVPLEHGGLDDPW